MPLPALAASGSVKLLGIDVTDQVKNLAGKALGSVGIHYDPKSPQQHIDERLAAAAPIKARALAGDRSAWEQLWRASSRNLPVTSIKTAPRNEGKDCHPGSCQSSGKTFGCQAGCTTAPFSGWPRVGGELETMLAEIEQQWPGGINSMPPAGTVSGDPLRDAGNSLATNLTDALPPGAKKAVADTARALGTTSSTLTWIAIGLAAVLIVKSLRS